MQMESRFAAAANKEFFNKIRQEPTLGDRIPLASPHSGSTSRGKNFGLDQSEHNWTPSDDILNGRAHAI
jgi:hypothetical protein